MSPFVAHPNLSHISACCPCIDGDALSSCGNILLVYLSAAHIRYPYSQHIVADTVYPHQQCGGIGSNVLHQFTRCGSFQQYHIGVSKPAVKINLFQAVQGPGRMKDRACHPYKNRL